jgi:hypothetical protein
VGGGATHGASATDGSTEIEGTTYMQRGMCVERHPQYTAARPFARVVAPHLTSHLISHLSDLVIVAAVAAVAAAVAVPVVAAVAAAVVVPVPPPPPPPPPSSPSPSSVPVAAAVVTSAVAVQRAHAGPVARPGHIDRARPRRAAPMGVPAVEGGVHRLSSDRDSPPIVLAACLLMLVAGREEVPIARAKLGLRPGDVAPEPAVVRREVLELCGLAVAGGVAADRAAGLPAESIVGCARTQ